KAAEAVDKPSTPPSHSKAKKAPKGAKPGVSYTTFDHADPDHKFACETCHDNIKEGLRVVDFPNAHDDRIEGACHNCHNRPTFTVVQKGAMCFICHVKSKAGGVTKDLIDFPDQRADQFGIIFPHETHKNLKAKDSDKAGLDIDLFLLLNGKDNSVQAVAKE